MDTGQTQVNLLVVRAFDALQIPYFLGGSMASPHRQRTRC
jgi:hypothetical protein